MESTKDIRRLDKSQTEAMFKLACYAFNKEPSVEKREHFARLCDHSWNYGLFVENKLASQVMCTPFEVNYFGTRYKMGGIGYVASYPEYRGQGGIREIMRMILTDMKKDGFALSYLAPFSYAFYRRFGYEQVFENISYHLSRNQLPPAPAKGTGYVRRVKLKEVEGILKELYANNPVNQRGGLVRMDWWWHYILNKQKEKNYAVYYNEKNQPEGYLIYERQATTFKISEWNYLSVAAFRGLGRFILSHESAFSEFVYVSPNNEHSLSYLLNEPNVTVDVQPYMMARIVDLQIFLANYPFLKVNRDCQFYLAVTDDYAPWNQGIWLLNCQKNQQPTLEKLTDDVNDSRYQKETLLSGNIQEWVQLFMGFRRPADLAFYERVAGPVAAFEILEEYIPRGLPTLVDYF